MRRYFKKIFFLMILAGLIFSALGMTAAYFSDKETSKENKFSAGTLDISLKKGSSSSTTLPFKIENMEPYQKFARIFEVRNTGSLPFSWTLSFGKRSEQKGIGGGQISELLQGEIFEGQDQPLLFWLNKAKNASNDEERQEDLDYFIEEVNKLRQAKLISDSLADDLVLKAKMVE